jgi:hypothetical protein
VTRAVRLTDVVLLACQFEVVDEAAERAADVTASDEAIEEDDRPGAGETNQEFDEPRGEQALESTRYFLEVEGARLEYVATIEGDEFVLIVHTLLNEPAAPYELELITGARYGTPDPPVSPDEAAGTLLFMAYPYIREAVFSITGRSPYQGFLLPALAKLPHPSITEAAPDDQTK